MIDLRNIAPRPSWPEVDFASDYYECEVCQKPFAEDEDSPREDEVVQHDYIWARCRDCEAITEDEPC